MLVSSTHPRRYMARNNEVIRQFTILRTLEAARLGLSIHRLAKDVHVSTRTIRRDLDALCEAGFPLYTSSKNTDGHTLWRLDGRVLAGVETGFDLGELCALYLSRHLAETLAGTPFATELRGAFTRIERLLPPRMREFLDRLPAILVTKAGPQKRGLGGAGALPQKLVDALVHHRVLRMQYFSVKSGRQKAYVVHPHQLAYADGGVYLQAWVPEYGEMRTFALERIRNITLEKETFGPQPAVSTDAFPDSLGVHSGPTERIELAFAPAIASYIREREWHPSQKTTDQDDGGVGLTLVVCNDWALRTWVLGFGPFVRVLRPESLARAILADLEAARTQYAPRFEFEIRPQVLYDARAQSPLPFPGAPHVRAAEDRG